VAEYRAHYAAENTHDIPPSLVAASLIVPWPAPLPLKRECGYLNKETSAVRPRNF
jgi:hypothetical protein